MTEKLPTTRMMKRVRKEIRELTLEQWYSVVDAMWILKEVNDSDGKAEFGPKFVSYDTLVAKHIAAGWATKAPLKTIKTYLTYLATIPSHRMCTCSIVLYLV